MPTEKERKNKMVKEISKHERDLVIFCSVVLITALTVFLFGRMYYYGKEVGYKEACQDFFSGKLKYEPLLSSDGKIKEWRGVSN